MRACLSFPLYNAVYDALQKKQQVILFQNRRGFAPYTECRQCAHVPHCVQCDVSLIYHKQQQKLVCHYCGYSVSPPKTCAACGSNQLQLKGMGTEKIEEDVELLFPKAKIARMDLDSTRSKYAYKQLLDDFENGDIDILIGTQMVSKGLDFKNVKVAGILSADSFLNFPDFRSYERAFQLLRQVSGRAGRDTEQGEVFIQTSQPAHPVLQHVLKKEDESFYRELLSERKNYHFPPFSRLIQLTVIAREKEEAAHLSQELFVLLKPHFPDELLGPEFPLVAKIKNQFHKRILIKVRKNLQPASVRKIIRDALDELQEKHKNWRFRVAINVDVN